ncbi:MAG: DNA methyltransferase [Bacteroidales bacterium]|nr:DNA methyltransferase [Bacteroidales bacterium]
MANESLSAAKAAKNDEFYTQYYDIEREINAYLEYNPDVFKDKTVLLPCDDPEWSNFTLYFAQHFQTLGLRKLISTSFAPESKKYKVAYQPSLFEQDAPQFDPTKTAVRGKIFELDHDIDGDGRIDFHDLEWRYLEGDGDFRSDEVKALRDEADIIITNPPFSLFREFLSWIIEAEKKCLMIGNTNAITYKEVFPLIKNNKLWLGATGFSTDMVFGVPEGTIVPDAYKKKAEKMGYVGNYTRLGNSCWFTNMEHGRRHQPLTLMTMEENIMYSRHKNIKGKGYSKYDNYDAIEVPFVDAIPSDYDGAMGVPITFLDKYCPEQFEILGISLEVATIKPIGLTKDKQGGPAFYTRTEEGLNRLYCRLVIKRVL